MKLYKFRSLNDYTKDELNKNYLYFATPEELNDPMEGFVKLYWDGDIVLWKNFLKHYLYTMAHCVITAALAPKLLKEDLPIFLNEEKFPTIEYKEIFENIRNTFFNEQIIIELLEYLNYFHIQSRRVSQQELENYLSFIRFYALYNINNEFKKRNLLDWNVTKPEYNNMFAKLLKLVPDAETQYPNLLGKMFSVSNNIMADIKLSQQIEIEKIDEIKKFFIYDFNNLYLNQIKNIICSSPCTTCFMEQYCSPSLWGYYGNNHKGICLIFDNKIESKEITFELKKEGYTLKIPTQKVKYSKKYEQINFFQMLGNLPKVIINKYWLQDWENNITSCKKIINTYTKSDFSSRYYNYFFNNFCTKLPDWKKEKEHRIVIQKDMFGCNSKDQRKFTYDFSLLTGIIFGIQTTDEQKKEIIKIIQNKCSKSDNREFKFYRTEYNEETGLIDIEEIKL